MVGEPLNQLGVEQLADALAALDVSVAFGLPGVHNLPIWEAFDARGIEIIGVRHEQTAAYAADGYARATGKLGVAVVTTGPGAANTLGATGEAYTVGSPILVIATDIETTVRRPGVFRGALHECQDQAAMFAPVTKRTVVSASSEDLGTDTSLAGRSALEHPRGPVYLGVPLDVLNGSAHHAPYFCQPAAVSTAVTEDELTEAAVRIDAAERPIIWLGGGATASGCGELARELAERSGAAVLTTYGAKGIVRHDHPQVLVSPPQVPLAEQLWDEADLVVSIGSDFDAMMTRTWKMAAPKQLLTINVDASDASKNYPAAQSLVGDSRTVLERLVPLVPESPKKRQSTIQRVAAIDAEIWKDVENECPEAAEFLDLMLEVLPADSNIVADMCIAGYWIGGFCRVPAPRKLAYPVGWGTLGFALPASIGTAAAGTGPTVVVCGDGGFLYAPGELATIAQASLPITIVIVDDGGYGMLKFAQDRAGVPHRGVDLVTPDFAVLASSFGLDTRSVDRLGREFGEALRAGVESRRPNVIWAKSRLLPPPNTSTRSASSKADK